MFKRRARVLAGLTLGAFRKLLSKLREDQQIERVLTRAQAQATAHSNMAAKRVLITGSTRGIGRALAEAFVRQGASVVVHGRRETEARAVAEQLGKVRSSHAAAAVVVGIGADLGLAGAGKTLVERAVAELGGLDLVINNAGVHDPKRKPIWETSGDEIEAVMRINFFATFEVCSAALASMIANGVAGRIINISTVAAKPSHVTAGGIATYGVSKFALEGLSHYLAAEAGPQGVTVTTLRPGMIDTDMVAPLFTVDWRLRMLPPESVVPPVLHLASAPMQEVHGRMFDQADLMEKLGGVSNGVAAQDSAPAPP
ncbi:MAG: hypothetical protein RL701_6831 [Pseudomonadota bacterium]|jgi:3-oxoacyl-[acyl-carrier protein] reductase